jgi:hypothetical protein
MTETVLTFSDWCERYRRMGRSCATRISGGGLGGAADESPHFSQRTREMGHPDERNSEETIRDGDGYYMVDRPDRGRRRDLDGG